MFKKDLLKKLGIPDIDRNEKISDENFTDDDEVRINLIYLILGNQR